MRLEDLGIGKLFERFRDAVGKPLYFVNQVQDIAKRKDAELRSVFGAMDDVIFVLDEEGRYLKVAPTHLYLLYRPADEVAGQPLDVFVAGDEAGAKESVIDLVESGGARDAGSLRRARELERLGLNFQSAWKLTSQAAGGGYKVER
jgi:PAS domain-containing protein